MLIMMNLNWLRRYLPVFSLKFSEDAPTIPKCYRDAIVFQTDLELMLTTSSLCEPKITYVHVTVFINEEVSRLQVAVQNVCYVEILPIETISRTFLYARVSSWSLVGLQCHYYLQKFQYL